MNSHSALSFFTDGHSNEFMEYPEFPYVKDTVIAMLSVAGLILTISLGFITIGSGTISSDVLSEIKNEIILSVISLVISIVVGVFTLVMILSILSGETKKPQFLVYLFSAQLLFFVLGLIFMAYTVIKRLSLL